MRPSIERTDSIENMSEHQADQPTPGQEGWFTDPENSKYNRLWDGKEWTSHRCVKQIVEGTKPHLFRPDSAPGPVYKRRLPKPAMGEIAAPGEPPVTGLGMGDGLLLILLRKLFGDHRDPRQK